MKNKTARRIYIPLSIVLLATILLILILENRYYVNFDNKTFTVWDTADGCYIIPSKYKKLMPPKENFIKMESNIELIIFVDDDDTYNIFCNHCYYDGCKPEVTLTEINYKVYAWESKDPYSKMKIFEESDCSYFDYEAKENWGHVKEKGDASVKFVLTADLRWFAQRFITGMAHFLGTENDHRN